MDRAVEEFISHYGKKGMRWGVRKARTTSNPHRQGAESKRTEDLRRRDPKTLTNRQLAEVNNRLNLEQNFGKLNPSMVSRGTAKATAILATVGIAVTAYNMATSPAGKAAIKAGKKFMAKAP